MRRRASQLVSIVALLACGAVARADGGAPCQGAGPRVVAATVALNSAPTSLPARIALADALTEANCYHEAVHTLEDGEAMHPRNAELQARLRTARSLVNEQEYFAGKDQAELAAKASRNLLRCTKLADVEACDDGLKLKPDDAELLLAKGDALLKAGRPAEAEPIYLRARRVTPCNPRVESQLAAAQAQRLSLVAQCQSNSDDAALRACRGALSKGAPDEFTVLTRIALLNQQRGQLAPALAAYIAAASLRQGDRGVALGIVALTDGSASKDAAALAARGSALLVLERGAEALVALRQLQALAPSSADLPARIAQAQRLAAAQPQPRTAVAAVTTPAVNAAPPSQPAAMRKYSNVTAPSHSY